MLRSVGLALALLAAGCSQTTTGYPGQGTAQPAPEVPASSEAKPGGSNNVPLAIVLGLVVGAAIMVAVIASSDAGYAFYDPADAQ